MSTLLDAGLPFLLRFALDDSVEGAMSAAVHALRALLVCAEDEVRRISVFRVRKRFLKVSISSLFLLKKELEGGNVRRFLEADQLLLLR